MSGAGTGQAERHKWIAEGYALGRSQAANVCREVSKRVDRRTHEEKEAGVRGSFTVRTLIATANRIGSMSRPDALASALLPDDDAPVLPCDLWLPPAVLLRAGTPMSTLAQELAQPGRPRTFQKGNG